MKVVCEIMPCIYISFTVTRWSRMSGDFIVTVVNRVRKRSYYLIFGQLWAIVVTIRCITCSTFKFVCKILYIPPPNSIRSLLHPSWNLILLFGVEVSTGNPHCLASYLFIPKILGPLMIRSSIIVRHSRDVVIWQYRSAPLLPFLQLFM